MVELHGDRVLDTAQGPFRVPATGTITRALQERGDWDEHVGLILAGVEGGWALDIGANVGWFTIFLARRHSRVFAIEPYPPTFRRLLYNVARRPGLEHRIQCWPIAASDRASVQALGIDFLLEDVGGTPFIQGNGDYVGVALDAYLPTNAPISVIKCDAQGADLKALKGLVMTIARCRPLIVFEWEEGLARAQGDPWERYLEFFALLDYEVTRITPNFWDFVARPR